MRLLYVFIVTLALSAAKDETTGESKYCSTFSSYYSRYQIVVVPEFNLKECEKSISKLVDENKNNPDVNLLLETLAVLCLQGQATYIECSNVANNLRDQGWDLQSTLIFILEVNASIGFSEIKDKNEFMQCNNWKSAEHIIGLKPSTAHLHFFSTKNSTNSIIYLNRYIEWNKKNTGVCNINDVLLLLTILESKKVSLDEQQRVVSSICFTPTAMTTMKHDLVSQIFSHIETFKNYATDVIIHFLTNNYIRENFHPDENSENFNTQLITILYNINAMKASSTDQNLEIHSSNLPSKIVLYMLLSKLKKSESSISVLETLNELIQKKNFTNPNCKIQIITTIISNPRYKDKPDQKQLNTEDLVHKFLNILIQVNGNALLCDEFNTQVDNLLYLYFSTDHWELTDFFSILELVTEKANESPETTIDEVVHLVTNMKFLEQAVKELQNVKSETPNKIQDKFNQSIKTQKMHFTSFRTHFVGNQVLKVMPTSELIYDIDTVISAFFDTETFGKSQESEQAAVVSEAK